jgi:hypothetical protein
VATVIVIEDERHIADVVRIAILDEPVDLAVTAPEVAGRFETLAATLGAQARRHQGRGEVGLPDAQGTPVDAPQRQRA